MNEKSEKKKEKKYISAWVGISLAMLLCAIVLELGRYTLLGWSIMAVAFGMFIVLYVFFMKDGKWYFKILWWGILALVFAFSLLVSRPPEKRVPAVSVRNPEKTEVVTVSDGDVQGVLNKEKDVEVFPAIPYAAPPVGDLRWKEPKDPEKWEGVLFNDHFAPMAMQNRGDTIYNALVDIIFRDKWNLKLGENYLEEMSEDCLYLNVWKPAGDVKDAPVLFYVHGGSLSSGQSYYDDYNGEAMAKKGIIFVSCAYRVNVFGYFASPELAAESPNGTTGNYGLLDQVKALEWVNENIEAFGGDPNNITIAGESAGSSSVNALCVSPLSKGLFRRAIAESSGILAKVPYHTFRSPEYALEENKKVYSDFNANNIDELRAVPADKLLKTTANNSAMTVDGYAIKEQPYLTYEKGENNEEALLNGFNADEAKVFLILGDNPKAATYHDYLEMQFDKEAADELVKLYPATTDKEAKDNYDLIMGAAWFAYSHYLWSNYLTEQGLPVYEYYFTKDNRGLGVYHAGEIPYVYGNLHRVPAAYDKDDYELEDIFTSYVINFCMTGNPNGGYITGRSADGHIENFGFLPQWDVFEDEGEGAITVHEMGDNIGPVDDPFTEIYRILDRQQERK